MFSPTFLIHLIIIYLASQLHSLFLYNLFFLTYMYYLFTYQMIIIYLYFSRCYIVSFTLTRSYVKNLPASFLLFQSLGYKSSQFLFWLLIFIAIPSQYIKFLVQHPKMF